MFCLQQITNKILVNTSDVKKRNNYEKYRVNKNGKYTWCANANSSICPMNCFYND